MALHHLLWIREVVGIKPAAKNRIMTVNCSIIDAAARDMTFSDDSFGYIVTLDAYEHSIDLDKALDEIYRVLKLNGLLYNKFGPIWFSAWEHNLQKLLL